MHELTILQHCVGPRLAGIHRRRLTVLLKAVAATVSGPRLTLTEIGRRLGGGSDLRHRIKRADRLLGNRHLRRDAKQIYSALARVLLAGVAEPLIVIDWSDPGHVLMENRHGLVIDTRVTQATGAAEREAAIGMVKALSGKHRVLCARPVNLEFCGFRGACAGM